MRTIKFGGPISLICILLFGMGQAWSIDPSVVLYLSLDAGQGEVAKDSSKYGNDGVLKENPKWVDGKFSKALAFETGNYVEIPASKSLHGDIFTADFTVNAWINPNLEGDTWQHITRSVAGDATQDTLFVNRDGRLSWRGRVGGSWTVLCETDPGVVKAKEWSHVAVVGDAKNFKVLVNAEVKKETGRQKTDGEIDTFFIAFDARRWQERYSGVIDEIIIVENALSSEEIKEIMEGVSKLMPVDRKVKLATTWGIIKFKN